MPLFKDILKNSESLIKDPIALDFDYIPKLLPYRENQQKYMATCIKPLFTEVNGKNLLIVGTQGIGKTAACKHVLRELEQETDDIHVLYINCWKKNSAYKMVVDICEQIGFKWIQNKRTDELLNEIVKILNKKSAVIVLDEIDKLDDFSVLYSLVEDVYKKSIFLITNEENWIVELDPRIKSRLMPNLLKFEPYNKEEIKGILKQRKDHAFVKDVFEEDAFNLIVEKTFEMNDIRAGLYLLKESASIAENKSSKKITFEEANEATNSLNHFKIKKVEDLIDDEKKILELIQQNSGKTIKELFDIYKNRAGEGVYRTFQRKITSLKESKMIDIEESTTPNGGRTTIVKYSIDRKLSDF